jgi:hypothetical protein
VRVASVEPQLVHRRTSRFATRCWGSAWRPRSGRSVHRDMSYEAPHPHFLFTAVSMRALEPKGSPKRSIEQSNMYDPTAACEGGSCPSAACSHGARACRESARNRPRQRRVAVHSSHGPFSAGRFSGEPSLSQLWGDVDANEANGAYVRGRSGARSRARSGGGPGAVRIVTGVTAPRRFRSSVPTTRATPARRSAGQPPARPATGGAGRAAASASVSSASVSSASLSSSSVPARSAAHRPWLWRA